MRQRPKRHFNRLRKNRESQSCNLYIMMGITSRIAPHVVRKGVFFRSLLSLGHCRAGRTEYDALLTHTDPRIGVGGQSQL